MADWFRKAWTLARRMFLSDNPVISPVLFWEIAIKASFGKLTTDVGEICEVITAQGFEHLGFSDRHMVALQALPFHRRDPFDRMLIVQSDIKQVPLLTSDKKIVAYPPFKP